MSLGVESVHKLHYVLFWQACVTVDRMADYATLRYHEVQSFTAETPTIARHLLDLSILHVCRKNRKLEKEKSDFENLKKEFETFKDSPRLPTSQTIKDLHEYILNNQKEDPLLQRKSSISCCIV